MKGNRWSCHNCSYSVANATHALLYVISATSHGSLQVRIITIRAARTLVSKSNMIRDDHYFFKRIGWGLVEQVLLVELRTLTRLM